MKKPTLWDISEEIKAFEDLIILDEGEISLSHEELEKEMLQLLNSKADGCYEYVESMKGMIKLAREKKAKITDYITSMTNTLERFNSYMIACLSNSHQDKFTGEFYEIKLRKPSKVLSITNENKIPLEFFSQPDPVIDKTALKNAYKNGSIEAKGFEMVDGKQSLQLGHIKQTKRKKDE